MGNLSLFNSSKLRAAYECAGMYGIAFAKNSLKSNPCVVRNFAESNDTFIDCSSQISKLYAVALNLGNFFFFELGVKHVIPIEIIPYCSLTDLSFV